MENFTPPRVSSWRNVYSTASTFFLFLLLLFSALQSQSASGFPDPATGLFPNISDIFNGPLPNWFNQSAGVWDGFKSLLDAHPGQSNCSNLPLMKRFLQQFGYSDPTSLDDYFDTRTEAAIKLYQRNFGLNVTGVLDESTIKQMIRPRCGREDVVDGISLMGGKSNKSLPHGTRHYSFFPNNPKWDSRDVLTYSISPNSASLTGIAQSDLDSLFADAFGEWAAVVPVSFTRVDDFSGADIKISFASGDHGDGKPFDGILGVLAHAFSPQDGRLHFDASETWTVDASSASSRNAMDLRSVAVHEIGHILGLGHSADESAIMFPNIGAREVKVKLTTDDIQGAQVLYGVNPNYNPDTQTDSRSQPENGIPTFSSSPVLMTGSSSRKILFVLSLLLIL